MHIGRNVWIPKSAFDNAVFQATDSNAMFVKTIAVSIFSLDVLKNSSITGTASNRCKGRAAKPQLDPSKLLSVKGR